MRRFFVALLAVSVALLAGCDLNTNPRYDACQWLDSAAGSDVKWFSDPGYERGGRCKIVAGSLSLATKDECTRVIGARNRLRQYSPAATAGQIHNYCFIH